MAQQQILLLVLGIIIVGLSVVFGINAFSINRGKANADELVNESLRVASDVQAWNIKPGMYGGRGSGQTLADVTFDALGYPNSGGTYQSLHGDLELSTSLGSDCDPPVVPSGKTPLIYINATNVETGNSVCVAVAGPADEDIGTDATYGSGLTS